MKDWAKSGQVSLTKIDQKGDVCLVTTATGVKGGLNEENDETETETEGEGGP